MRSAFARRYDKLTARMEDAWLREARAALLAGLSGTVVELGAGTGPPCLPDLSAPLARAHRLGAPVLPVAERLAARLRTDALQRRLEAAERLPVQLTVPTTLLLLPAALLVVLAPVLDAALAPLR